MNTKIFEANMDRVRKDSDLISNPKLNEKSPIVEIFASATRGEDLSKYGNKADVALNRVKELANQSMAGNYSARAELNTIQKFIIAPELTKMVQLFSFMGNFKDIGYADQPMVKTYKHEGVRSNFQATHGDVPFAVTSWEEYPIKTQNISTGYAVDYREIASGNLDKVSEGMEQVKTDMMNKAMYYVIMTMYDRIKNAKGVKYFAEANGISKTAVDDMLKKIRRFGATSVIGDYSVVSQMNSFQGFDFAGTGTSKYLSEAVMEEIRKNGLPGAYNGSSVVELPNQYNLSQLNSAGDNFTTYMPEGLLFFIPQGSVSPLQIFRRGGLNSASGFDVVTGTEMTRFDMEIGADVAKGQEYKIGLLRDKSFDTDLLK